MSPAGAGRAGAFNEALLSGSILEVLRPFAVGPLLARLKVFSKKKM
jgi:hypothetical protein